MLSTYINYLLFKLESDKVRIKIIHIETYILKRHTSSPIVLINSIKFVSTKSKNYDVTIFCVASLRILLWEIYGVPNTKYTNNLSIRESFFKGSRLGTMDESHLSSTGNKYDEWVIILLYTSLSINNYKSSSYVKKLL